MVDDGVNSGLFAKLRQRVPAMSPALARQSAAGFLGLMLIITLWAVVYGGGIFLIHPVDRDECRFAQASRQMYESVALPISEQDRRFDDKTGLPAGLHSGGLAIPMLVDKPRLNKPPLIYWLQAGSAAIFTWGDPRADAMWMYRVPSAVSVLITAVLLWWVGKRMFEPRVALLGACLLLVAPMIVWDGRQARADSLLVACTTAAMVCLWMRTKAISADADREILKLQVTGRTGWLIGLWVCVGLGVLAKGFITPMIVLLAIGSMAWALRSWNVVRAVRPLMGLGIVAVVVAPWLMVIAQQFGLSKYATLVWNETFVRAATGSHEGHFGPPGMHLVLLIALLWPASLSVMSGVGWAFSRVYLRDDAVSQSVMPSGFFKRVGWWLARIFSPRREVAGGGRVSAALFCLAWAIPGFVVFELSLAKLPHYTMPVYPALALLASRAVLGWWMEKRPFAWKGIIIWIIVPVAVMLAAAAAGEWRSPVRSGMIPLILLLLQALVIAPFLWLALRSAQHRDWKWAMQGGIVAAVGLAMISVPLAASAFAPGWRTVEYAGSIRQHMPEFAQGRITRPIATMDHEDSVQFLLRGQALRVGPKRAAEWLEQNPSGILILGAMSDGAKIGNLKEADRFVSRRAVEGFRVVGPVGSESAWEKSRQFP
jgi:4-amino-4-deoxy-L-arabinose transferase-like glycosyltransferase